MATNFLSAPNSFLVPSTSSSSPSLSLATVTPTYVYHPIKCSVKRQLILCKAVDQSAIHSPSVTKRDYSISFLASSVLSLAEYLQDVVYKLSKVGEAIENNDIPTAGSVLVIGTDTGWVQKATIALTKLSSSPEEKTEKDTFNSSLASLISSVTQNGVESSKVACVFDQCI